MPRNQMERVALRDGGQHELRFHHRKGVADALARSSSKGKIGEARATSRTFWRKAFRVEHLRLLPACRVTMGTIGAKKDDAFSRNNVAANLIRRCGKPREAEDGWVEPHGLLDHHARVRQRVQVFNRGSLPRKNRI